MTNEAPTNRRWAGVIDRLRPYAELGKFRVVDLWLGFLVGWSLLPASTAWDGRTGVILALIFVTTVVVAAAACSLDDVMGVRDGVDIATQKGTTRYGIQKPVLNGTLSDSKAMRFAIALIAVAAATIASVIAVAWPLPLWLIAYSVGVVVVALNYSYGLKLSYHGLGEVVMFLAGATTVLVPYGFVAGALTPIALWSAACVGFWHIQVVVFSNTQDAAGDRATGRMTMAARSSDRGNSLYICVVFGASWAVGLAALILPSIDSVVGFALTPIWLGQVYQLVTGVIGKDWLRARFYGFWLMRGGIAVLVATQVGLKALG